MMDTIFQALILTSCVGAVLGGIFWLCKPFTQKYFSASWNYYIWLVVLLVMILPMGSFFAGVGQRFEDAGNWLRETLTEAAEKEELLSGEAEEVIAREVLTDEKGHMLVSAQLQEIRAKEWNLEKWHRWVKRAAPVWAQVAFVVFALRIAGYMTFLWKVLRTTKRIRCPQLAAYTRRKVTVRTGDWVVSPLLMGVVRPTLLLPHWDFTEEQLGNILAHETTHLRRNDMLYKWLLVLVKSFHWFNPMVYIVGHQVSYACEISCDLAVTGSMSMEEKKSYVETILALFTERRTLDYGMAMGMGGSKGMLKKRFIRMKTFSAVSKGIRRLSNFSAGVLLVGALGLCAGAVVYANAAGMWDYEIDHESGFPYLTECENCEELTLFYNRAMVGKTREVADLYYYVYLFECKRCNHKWSERELLEREYIVEITEYGKTFMTYQVETMPKVVDREADEALAAAGIDLSEEADDAKEALEIINKAIRRNR